MLEFLICLNNISKKEKPSSEIYNTWFTKIAGEYFFLISLADP